MELMPLLLSAARLIGWALVHFVWQAALLGVVYAIGRRLLPRGEARYRLGMGVLLALALCPLLTVWRLLEATPAAIGTATSALLSGLAGAGVTADAAVAWSARLDALLPWLVLAWSLGVLLLSLRAWRQWQRLKVLLRLAEQLPAWQQRVDVMARRFGLRRRVSVLCSRIVSTPVLVGWIRPVILLPVAVVCDFPLAQIELILAHELAHLHRWDPLANLFQVLLETLYFYHPVVYWISRDVRNEREICCDQLTLAISGGHRREYVAALAELGELRERHPSLLLAANGGVLLDRVQQLTLPTGHGAAQKPPIRFAAMLLGAALIALVLVLQWKQALLQRSLANPILSLSSLLVPPLQSLAGSLPAWHLIDLVLPHGRIERPLGIASAAVTTAVPQHAQIDVAPALLLPQITAPRMTDIVPASRMPAIAEVDRVDPAAVMAAPTPIRIRQPIYPQDALERGIEGQVVIEFGLAVDGSVRDLQVVSSKPAGVFERAAMQALRGWKYGLPASVAAPTRYRQVMAFSLHSIPGAAAGREEIHARTDCQIVTGTLICRWPNDAGASTSTRVETDLGALR